MKKQRDYSWFAIPAIRTMIIGDGVIIMFAIFSAIKDGEFVGFLFSTGLFAAIFAGMHYIFKEMEYG